MKKILIVNANYYDEITSKLVVSAKSLLKKNNFKVWLVNVPGVFEIPYMLKKNIKKYDAFISIGCVIKGKTPHFDLICKSTFSAITDLSIHYSKPIGNGIITALNLKQAYERCGKIKSKYTNKGFEAALAVSSTLKNEPKKI